MNNREAGSAPGQGQGRALKPYAEDGGPVKRGHL